jgi:hypothetical protein
MRKEGAVERVSSHVADREKWFAEVADFAFDRDGTAVLRGL